MWRLIIHALLLCWINTCCVYTCPLVNQCHCTQSALFCVEANFTEIPSDIPVEVKHLDFHKGHLELIEADKLSHLTELQELTMDENQIMDIENGTFDSVVELRKISFNRNKLSYLIPGLFSRLKNLKYLFLSGNYLQDIEGVLEGLSELESLYLDYNQITYVTGDTFKQLPKLYDLQMNNNQLKQIPPDTFQHNPSLMILGVGSNPISSLDNVFDFNPNFHYINLTDCNFTTFPASMSQSLKYLKLRKNRITHIYKNETSEYSNLTTLIIEENGLQYIEKDALLSMTKLTEVFLFVNNLTTMPGKFPRSVKNIYLDSNRISSIPSDTFEEYTELNLLSIRSNDITTFDMASFSSILVIRELKLDGNPLRILHDNIFLLVPGLKHLTLNHLDMHEIYPNCLLGLDSLQVLEMSRVTVQKEQNILGNFLVHVSTLETLNLEESPLLAKYFLSHVTVMESVTNLTELNLGHNGLTTIPSVLPWHLPYLQKLYLAGNPFMCTEEHFWLQEWYLMEPVIFKDIDEVFCHLPDHLQGKLLKNVDLLDFQKDQYNASNDEINDNTTEIVTTEVNHYDYYDITTKFDYEEYYDNLDDYYEHSYDSYDKDYENYDFLTYSTVVITKHSQQSSTTPGTVTTPNMDIIRDTSHPIPNNPKDPTTTEKNTSHIKSITLAICMAAGVIVIMLFIAAVVYCIFLRRNRNVVHHNARQNNGTNDYVFIVSKTDIPTETEAKPQRKLTREERGSTTSHASEDVTHDNSLKVYTIEMEQ